LPVAGEERPNAASVGPYLNVIYGTVRHRGARATDTHHRV